MAHDHDEPHELPVLAEEDVAKALEALGYAIDNVHGCLDCAPVEPGDRIAGMLGGLFAVVQVHIIHRPDHADVVTGAYHVVKEHLGHGGPCQGCGQGHGTGHEIGPHA